MALRHIAQKAAQRRVSKTLAEIEPPKLFGKAAVRGGKAKKILQLFFKGNYKMKIDLNTYFTLLAPILTLFIGVFINRFFERKAKLMTYLSNVSAFKISKNVEEAFQVFTHSIVIKNTGGKSSKNVRIGHSNLPNFTIHPEIEYKVIDLPNGGKEISIPSLVPNEQVIVNYLYFPPITWDQINTHVKSDDGFAKVINVLLTPQYSTIFKYIFFTVSTIGLSTIVYFMIIVARHIIMKVPY